MRITRIEPHRQRLDSVYIDDEFAGNVDRDVLALSGFAVDSPIEQAQFSELLTRSDRKRAKDKALWLLGRRAHTRSELLVKIARSTSQAAAEYAVARMEELGMVNDADYARRYAAELAERRCYAAGRIVQELRRKGIDSTLAEEVIEELSPDPAEQIRTLLEGKFGRFLEVPNGKNKVIAALQRYGFPWSDIAPCLREWIAEQENRQEDEDEGGVIDGDYNERIRYLLETKYRHALGTEKDRKRAVSSLVARGFSRRQIERVMHDIREQYGRD